MPASREEWARLAQKLGVKGVHIAERDTQHTGKVKPVDAFWNTWSVNGLLSESLQPAELGYGTHETWHPAFMRTHAEGCQAAVYLTKPGVKTQVRTWCPSSGPQIGYLITHNEAISISDYFTARDEYGKVEYRPTCHYAYRPCEQAVISLLDLVGRPIDPEEGVDEYILDEKDIVGGYDELGVLLYGHEKNAYWYGTKLSIEEARKLAPDQNATGLQVTSAVLAGIVWALENPEKGIVEAEEMDFERCLEVQRPYLG